MRICSKFDTMRFILDDPHGVSIIIPFLVAYRAITGGRNQYRHIGPTGGSSSFEAWTGVEASVFPTWRCHCQPSVLTRVGLPVDSGTHLGLENALGRDRSAASLLPKKL